MQRHSMLQMTSMRCGPDVCRSVSISVSCQCFCEMSQAKTATIKEENSQSHSRMGRGSDEILLLGIYLCLWLKMSSPFT